MIIENCLPGTVFCSDSWKACYKLPEHLDLEDVLYFPVNNTTSYVDPVTGAVIINSFVNFLANMCVLFALFFG